MITLSADRFVHRHLGPTDADIQEMLATLGLQSLDALVDATWPLLMPTETVAPPPQAELAAAIWTFHSPSNVAAATGVAANIPRRNRIRMVKSIARKRRMTFPFVPTQSISQIASPGIVIEITQGRRSGRLRNKGA